VVFGDVGEQVVVFGDGEDLVEVVEGEVDEEVERRRSKPLKNSMPNLMSIMLRYLMEYIDMRIHPSRKDLVLL
jgi:hypothetical protein